MSEIKKDIGQTADVTAILGVLMLFISIFRSEYLSFLDIITWNSYYLSQLLFMALLIAVVAYLIGKFSVGSLSLRELTEAAKEIKNIPEYDEKTKKRRSGEIVFLVNPIVDLQIDRGVELQPTMSQFNYSQIKRQALHAKIGQLFVILIVILIGMAIIFVPEVFDYIYEMI